MIKILPNIKSLVFGITNINELEGKNNIDKIWKTTNIGISLLLIIIYTALIGCIITNENGGTTEMYNNSKIFICSLILACVSTYHSYSIFDRLTKFEKMGMV